MPKAYWVVNYRSIKNPEARQAYAKLAVPAIQSAGGRFLARSNPAKTYEAGVNQRVDAFLETVEERQLVTSAGGLRNFHQGKSDRRRSRGEEGNDFLVANDFQNVAHRLRELAEWNNRFVIPQPQIERDAFRDVIR